ncbi:MAG TPA: UdgX family uracil-DNA binding protein [Candidatus Xenobia bacterium]|jgi:DNA polymerase
MKPERPPVSAASLPSLAQDVQACRGCDLWERATQAVFGEGPRHASVLMVGEQPGDQEDRLGHPFVGPAGHLLDACLAEAGLERSQVWLTNAVKHFRWEESGPEQPRRRLHKKPSARQVAACRPWLDAEIGLVRPRLVVCLGATAAQSLLGTAFRLTEERGGFRPWRDGLEIMATVHPSSLLRIPEPARRHAERARFIEELREVARRSL